MKEVKAQKIISVKPFGVQKTIDLEVDSENHNFYCNGILVSNSHSVSYSVLASKTTYLKFVYPQYFFLSLLKSSKDEPDPHSEINTISKELVYFNIKLLPPDLSKSELDFSLEGPDIRFGLNSIRGVADAALVALTKFRNRTTSNKFEIFVAAKESGINIGVLSNLIRAGCLSSYTENRSRLALEAMSFNILTDGEKRFCMQKGAEYNYDLLNLLLKCAFEKDAMNDKGKSFMSAKRKETFKSKYTQYKQIYEHNKKNAKLSQFLFEKNVLGYNPSIQLKTCFNEDPATFTDTLQLQSVEKGDLIKLVGSCSELYKSKSKKSGRDFVRFQLKDELGMVNCLLMDSDRKARLSDYLESGGQLPETDDLVCVSARKGDDVCWVEGMSVINEQAMLKVSDLQKLD